MSGAQQDLQCLGPLSLVTPESDAITCVGRRQHLLRCAPVFAAGLQEWPLLHQRRLQSSRPWLPPDPSLAREQRLHFPSLAAAVVATTWKAQRKEVWSCGLPRLRPGPPGGRPLQALRLTPPKQVLLLTGWVRMRRSGGVTHGHLRSLAAAAQRGPHRRTLQVLELAPCMDTRPIMETQTGKAWKDVTKSMWGILGTAWGVGGGTVGRGESWGNLGTVGRRESWGSLGTGWGVAGGRGRWREGSAGRTVEEGGSGDSGEGRQWGGRREEGRTVQPPLAGAAGESRPHLSVPQGLGLPG